MSKINLGQVLTFLANVGVIAGIVFLAAELRQSNRIAVASTEIDVRNGFSSINETIYEDNEVAGLLLRVSDPSYEMTPVERIRVSSLIRRLLNAWLALEIAYENGLVPPDTYSIIRQDPKSFISRYPATIPEWRVVLDIYSEQGSREVMRVVASALEGQ